MQQQSHNEPRRRDAANTPATSEFLFVICQPGAEAALKAELAREHPELRFAFSRPGFVTFRTRAHIPGTGDHLRSTFARTFGSSIGKCAGETAEQKADSLWALAPQYSFDHIHVWERDRFVAGERGFEPGITPLAAAMGDVIGERQRGCGPPVPVNRAARDGQTVLDCVLVEPADWWLGIHTASSPPLRWPGGVHAKLRDKAPISRAYYKMQEALSWTQLPLRPGDVCLEIGCAPGGSVECLLERGVTVLGVDPAEVDARLAEHPRFEHLQRRVADIPLRRLRDVRWLFADANVAPQSILQDVAKLLAHESVNIRGMLLTLKLLDANYVDNIPRDLERVKSFGFEYVRGRQLSYNRQEFCLAALRKRSMRRPSRRRRGPGARAV